MPCVGAETTNRGIGQQMSRAEHPGIAFDAGFAQLNFMDGFSSEAIGRVGRLTLVYGKQGKPQKWYSRWIGITATGSLRLSFRKRKVLTKKPMELLVG